MPDVTLASPPSSLSRFLLPLGVFYYLPPLLLATGVVPFSWRFKMLAIMTFIMIAYDRRQGFTLKDLGIRKDTLKGSLLLHLLVSLLLVIFMFLSFKAGIIRAPTVPGRKMFFVYYLFISCPSQEFLFRSNLFALMDRYHIRGAALQIVLSAITYSFLHIFYLDVITLIATLIIGIVWGGIYYLYPNFWGVTLSHAILGITSILVGLI
ncbi:MAG TPA: CPBP family intramembrane glutamic endopeptidase [Pyrinomonadaceae bacterium]